jgi:hypothetical protein
MLPSMPRIFFRPFLGRISNLDPGLRSMNDEIQEWEALTGLALLSRMFEIDRLVSYLICEIGYHRETLYFMCESCVNAVKGCFPGENPPDTIGIRVDFFIH